MSTQSRIAKVQALVEDDLGDDAVAHDEGTDRFHPQSVFFFCDEPNADFTGFSPKELFEVNIIGGELDDDHKHRVERHGDMVIYTAYDRDSSRCTYHAGGQALVCEPGSDAESVFLANAAASVVLEAAGSLRTATDAIKSAGITLGRSFKETTVKQLFGD